MKLFANDPERSYNANINYITKIVAGNSFIGVDVTGFYSYFTNKIIGDFESDPDKIIYDNLRGHAVSRGVSVNTGFNFNIPLNYAPLQGIRGFLGLRYSLL